MRNVSVVICAYSEERWTDLGHAVESAHDQPECGEVVVVIDHASRLLERARARWPAHRVVANAHARGLSGARNTGTEVARFDLVAYLDDDARAESDWLAHLVAALDPQAAVGAGGRAEPVWPSKRPRFLPRELNWIVGCTFTGQPERLAEVRNVMGCSMLFRRSAVLDVGGFSSDTGRVGSIPLGGEETDLCIRLRRASPGSSIVFEPRSVVRHRVSADRVRWRYLCRRSFYEGVSKAGLSRRLGSGDALSNERSYVVVVLPRGIVRSVARGDLIAAAGIVTSLACTVAGYLFGRARTGRGPSGRISD